mgnify:CR=1 FL=1
MTLSQLANRAAARGMGAGMGGGGHANNPAFMFQADYAKNKWKGAVFVITCTAVGTLIPWFSVRFARFGFSQWRAWRSTGRPGAYCSAAIVRRKRRLLADLTREALT